MRRYAVISLAIGAGAASVASLLHFFGAFAGADGWLFGIFSGKGVIPNGSEPVRVEWLEIVLAFLVSLGVAWCVVEIESPGSKALIALGGFAAVAGMAFVAPLYGATWGPFPSIVGLVLASAGAFVFAGTELGMRKRVLREMLGDRVSRQVFDRMLESSIPPDFSGASREVTVLTCRLFDHDVLREKLEPTDLVALSTLFVRSAGNFLVSRGGYVDESGPDLVRAHFGLLEPDPGHAVSAAGVALELVSRLRNLSKECETRWFQPMKYGVGIASGTMTGGVFGSGRRRFFSGVGPVTDYSRRLAHANFRYGSGILVGPETYRLLGDAVEVRPMEMFYDPERDVMTEIYELLAMAGGLDEGGAERRARFWNGVILFREGRFEDALDELSQARRGGESDPPLEFFLARVQESLAGKPSSEGERRGTSGKATGGKEGQGHSRLIHRL